MRKTLIISMILLTTSCSNIKEQEVDSKIINDIFLSIVDTIAYKEHSLRPPPPSVKNNETESELIEHQSKNNNKEIFIIISDTLMNFNKWEKQIDNFFKEDNQFDVYKDIFKRNLDFNTKKTIINLPSITNTGRYKLILSNKGLASNSVVAGKVEFSRVAYNKELTKALIVVTISQGKAGVTKLLLLSYREKWVIEKEDIFEIW